MRALKRIIRPAVEEAVKELAGEAEERAKREVAERVRPLVERLRREEEQAKGDA